MDSNFTMGDLIARDPTFILRNTAVQLWPPATSTLKRYLENLLAAHTQNMAPLDIDPTLVRLRPAALHQSYNFVTLAAIFEEVCSALAARGRITHYGIHWVTDYTDLVRRPQPYLHVGSYDACPTCNPVPLRLQVGGVVLYDVDDGRRAHVYLTDRDNPHGRVVGG